MQVGIGLTLQERDDADDGETIRRGIGLAIAAEDLGFEAVMVLEHHLTGYSMLPAPFEFLAYIAALTTRLRLATGVAIVPLTHPVRLAEQVMVLDMLSSGRALLGLGTGRPSPDHRALMSARDDDGFPRETFDEALGILLRLLADREVTYDGAAYRSFIGGIRPWHENDISARTFCAASSFASLECIATHGVRLLVAADAANAVECCRTYDACRRSVGRASSQPIVVARAHIDRSSDAAQRRAAYFSRSEAASAAAHFDSSHTVELTAQYDVIGDAATCVGVMNAIQAAFDPEVLFLEVDFGGMPFGEVERSVRQFADEVLPHFQGKPRHRVGS